MHDQDQAPAPAATAPCCHQPAAAPSQPHDGDDAAANRRAVWRRSAVNTAICLAGCTIGDVGVVLARPLILPQASILVVMLTAIAAGIATSIALETVWLRSRGARLADALRTAMGMSLISMIAMETAMNVVDLGLTGGMRAAMGWTTYAGVLALGEVAGFLVAWPYNAWRLRSLGLACH